MDPKTKTEVLDRVATRIQENMTEADGLRWSEKEGGVTFEQVPSKSPDTRLIEATVDGVGIRITLDAH